MKKLSLISTTHAQVLAGQAVYTKTVLALYDVFVLMISNPYIWKCSTSQLLQHYHINVSSNHLDVGVGSGYFLDRCQFPVSRPRIGIMDLNLNSLNKTKTRIARYQPEIYQQNILEPLSLLAPRFDSIGINFLLHCLPGTMRTKEVVFANIKKMLKPKGVVFGSTLLNHGVPKTYLAKALMKFYNAKGVFSNTHDTLDDLRSNLENNFSKTEISVIGSVALFRGQL